MGRIIGLATLVVGGIIVADFLIHPTGTLDVAKGASEIVTPTESALLGK